MNTYFLIAAGIMLILCVNHSFSGERFIVRPLLRLEPFPSVPFVKDEMFVRRIVRFSWHLWTVPWLGFVVALVGYSRGPLDTGGLLAVKMIAATCLMSAVVTAAIARGKHFAWPLFLIEAGLLWAGLT